MSTDKWFHTLYAGCQQLCKAIPAILSISQLFFLISPSILNLCAQAGSREGGGDRKTLLWGVFGGLSEPQRGICAH